MITSLKCFTNLSILSFFRPNSFLEKEEIKLHRINFFCNIVKFKFKNKLMRNTLGSRLKIIALSFLIMAMTLLMYNEISDFKYWIGVIIIFVTLIIMNYDYFILYKKNKDDNQ